MTAIRYGGPTPFPGEPAELAGCPLNSFSPLVHKVHSILGHA